MELPFSASLRSRSIPCPGIEFGCTTNLLDGPGTEDLLRTYYEMSIRQRTHS
jgi:hypothetical protein